MLLINYFIGYESFSRVPFLGFVKREGFVKCFFFLGFVNCFVFIVNCSLNEPVQEQKKKPLTGVSMITKGGENSDVNKKS